MLHQIHNILKQNENCTIRNKLFYSTSSNIKERIRNRNIETEQVDFKCNKAQDTIHKWIHQNGDFKGFNLRKDILHDADFLLSNISILKGKWIKTTSDGCVMKIINSFNYTEDVKYEARFLELPTQAPELKLVIIVPNETDLLHTLFRRLTNKGLTAACSSIQPSFVTTSKLDAPSIDISSETEVDVQNDVISNGIAKQYGNVKVDGNGIFVKVLTCLYSTKAKSSCSMDEKVPPDEKPPFFFAVVFEDTPIFTGQYNVP